MKKVLLALALAFGTFNASAQTGLGCFNNIGVGVGVGTPGISFEVATPVTKWAALRLGMNIMPGIKVKGDVDIDASADLDNGQSIYFDNMEAEASFSRTTVDVMADVYPFGGSFFVSAGLSFGGGKLAAVKGHSDEVQNFYAQYPQYTEQMNVLIDQYRIPIDQSGNIDGGIKVSSVRPYVGLGFGRAVPKHRVGFRFDAGVYFHGKPKVFAGDINDVLKDTKADYEGSDDISKIVDKLTVYPVIKFSLHGRIL